MSNEQDKGLLNQKQCELSEEDLTNVAGGAAALDNIAFFVWKEKAEAAGYTEYCGIPCPQCKVATDFGYSVYSKPVDETNVRATLERTVACFACHRKFQAVC